MIARDEKTALPVRYGCAALGVRQRRGLSTAAPITFPPTAESTPGTSAAWSRARSSPAALKDKKNTAIFIGGGNMAEGEAVLGRRAQEILRQVPRLRDVRLQRLQHHGRGCRGVAGARPLARGQARRRARRLGPGRAARRGAAGPRGRRRGDHRPQARGRASGLRCDPCALRHRGAGRRGADQRRTRRRHRGRADRARHRRRRHHACWKRGNGRTAPRWNWWPMPTRRRRRASKAWARAIAASSSTARFCSGRWASARSSWRCIAPALRACSSKTISLLDAEEIYAIAKTMVG